MGKDAVDQLFDVIEREDSDTEHSDTEDVDIVLRVHVQPGAGRSAVVGRHGDALKIKVAAPPEGGRANQAVADLLASTLGVTSAGIRLVSGATSRSKRFRIGPVALDTVRRLIASAESAPQAGGTGRGGNARGGGGVR